MRGAHRHRYGWRHPLTAPGPRVVLDRSHPMAAGLWGLWLFGRGVGYGAGEILTGQPGPLNGSVNYAVGPAGPCLQSAGNGGVFQQNLTANSSVAFTIAMLAAYGSNGALGALRASGTVRNAFTHLSGAPQYTVNYGTTVTLSGTSSAPGDMGMPFVWIGTTRSATDHQLFINGISEATSTTNCGATSPGRNQLLMGQTGGGNGGSGQTMYSWFAWERAFSAEEARAFADDPYGLLIPEG